jgi:AcrR family transcriptional regulator
MPRIELVARSPASRDPSSRAPIGLDADDVVAAARALLDEFGVAGTTIRRVAGRLGVTAPTIYWHVGSKAELLQLVAEHVVDEMNIDSRATVETWDEELRSFISAARRQLAGHPYIIDVLRDTLPRASAVWSTRALRIMQKAGFRDESAALYAHIVIWHIVGFSTIEVNTKANSAVMEAVPGRRNVYRVRAELYRAEPGSVEERLAEVDLDAQHDATVELLIAALREELAR